MTDDVAAQIVRDLSRKTGVAEDKIERGSQLYGTLGLDGDDASEFFDEVARRYGTDLSALWSDWRSYFRGEPTLLSIFSKRERQTPSKQITVGEVVAAVERGSW